MIFLSIPLHISGFFHDYFLWLSTALVHLAPLSMIVLGQWFFGRTWGDWDLERLDQLLETEETECSFIGWNC